MTNSNQSLFLNRILVTAGLSILLSASASAQEAPVQTAPSHPAEEVCRDVVRAIVDEHITRATAAFQAHSGRAQSQEVLTPLARGLNLTPAETNLLRYRQVDQSAPMIRQTLNQRIQRQIARAQRREERGVRCDSRHSFRPVRVSTRIRPENSEQALGWTCQNSRHQYQMPISIARAVIYDEAGGRLRDCALDGSVAANVNDDFSVLNCTNLTL